MEKNEPCCRKCVYWGYMIDVGVHHCTNLEFCYRGDEYMTREAEPTPEEVQALQARNEMLEAMIDAANLTNKGLSELSSNLLCKNKELKAQIAATAKNCADCPHRQVAVDIARNGGK